MNIIVVGSDLRTQVLIRSLINAKHHITLISKDNEFCTRIADQINMPAIYGDASQLDVLESAKLCEQELLIAMSEKDADNLIVCELAKKKMGIPRTIAMVENPVNCTVFQRLGVDSVICSAEVCSQQISSIV